jgi:hypothetical protein
MLLLSQKPAVTALKGHPRAIRDFVPLLMGAGGGNTTTGRNSGGGGGGNSRVSSSSSSSGARLDDLVEAAHQCYLEASGANAAAAALAAVAAANATANATANASFSASSPTNAAGSLSPQTPPPMATAHVVVVTSLQSLMPRECLKALDRWSASLLAEPVLTPEARGQAAACVDRLKHDPPALALWVRLVAAAAHASALGNSNDDLGKTAPPLLARKVRWEGRLGLAEALERDLNELSSQAPPYHHHHPNHNHQQQQHQQSLPSRRFGPGDVAFLKAMMARECSRARVARPQQPNDDGLVGFDQFVAFAKWWSPVARVVAWLGSSWRGGMVADGGGDGSGGGEAATATATRVVTVVHGFLDRGESNEKLRGQEAGTFLFRFSESKPGKLVIAVNDQVPDSARIATNHCLVDVAAARAPAVHSSTGAATAPAAAAAAATSPSSAGSRGNGGSGGAGGVGCAITFEDGRELAYESLAALVLDCRRLEALYAPQGNTAKGMVFSPAAPSGSKAAAPGVQAIPQQAPLLGSAFGDTATPPPGSQPSLLAMPSAAPPSAGIDPLQ